MVAIKAGRKRWVVLVPQWKLVFKFPRLHLWEAIQAVWGIGWYLRYGGWYLFHHDFFSRQPGSFRSNLLGGFESNWLEYRLWHNSPHKFYQPTLFSLFGLVNVQAMGDPWLNGDDDLFAQLYRATNGEIFKDAHHFAHIGNFCLDDGRVRMVDYGSAKVDYVVRKYGDALVSGISLTYSWEEEKVRLRKEEHASAN